MCRYLHCTRLGCPMAYLYAALYASVATAIVSANVVLSLPIPKILFGGVGSGHISTASYLAFSAAAPAYAIHDIPSTTASVLDFS